jgi:hypothetical protein
VDRWRRAITARRGGGIFDVLLGDANPAVVGDEIRGATVTGPSWPSPNWPSCRPRCSTTLADAPWLHRDTPVNQGLITALRAAFVDRYGDRIAPQHRMVCDGGRRIRRRGRSRRGHIRA